MKILLILFSVILFSSLSTVYAQSDETISVKSDLPSYGYGDSITISGIVKNLAEHSLPVTIVITSFDGNIVTIAQVMPDSDGNYSHTLKAGGTMNTEGDYEISAFYDAQEITSTFVYTGGTAPIPIEPTPESIPEPTPIPQPPPGTILLEKLTYSEAILVTLEWPEIYPHELNSFKVSFYDPKTGNLLDKIKINYDITITQHSREVEGYQYNLAKNGSNEFQVMFPNDSVGPAQVIILLKATADKGLATVYNEEITFSVNVLSKHVVVETQSEQPKVTQSDQTKETQSEQPNETSPITIDNGGGCLIATAAYGSELAPQVQLLREIRDNKVMSTDSGMSFMGSFNTLYYSFSPYIADYERENPLFKEAVKLGLTPLLSSLSILSVVDVNSEQEMISYGVGIILLNIGMYFAAPAMLFYGIKKKLLSKF